MSPHQNTGRKLPTRAVCARYAISDRTLARWIRNPELGFPRPTFINNRMFFDEAELAAWDEAMAAKSRRAA
ncbi:helix-turn-helix domain-containing protein [Bradyrhizobium sp. Leo170]|nr:helix-turn-helix domain-containing protein [Bradyrhizobium sp. Leo170]